MKHPNKLIHLFLAASWMGQVSHAVQAEPAEYAPVTVSIYNLSPAQPVSVTTEADGAIDLELYSAATSDWVELTPPIRFATPVDGKSAIWAPGNKTIGGHYILLIKNPSPDEPYLQIKPILANEQHFPASSLKVINLNDQNLDCSFNGKDFVVAPQSHATLEKQINRFNFRARGTKTPVHSNISITENDPSKQQILVIAPPHIKGSSLLSHRVIQVSDQ